MKPRIANKINILTLIRDAYIVLFLVFAYSKKHCLISLIHGYTKAMQPNPQNPFNPQNPPKSDKKKQKFQKSQTPPLERPMNFIAQDILLMKYTSLSGLCCATDQSRVPPELVSEEMKLLVGQRFACTAYFTCNKKSIGAGISENLIPRSSLLLNENSVWSIPTMVYSVVLKLLATSHHDSGTRLGETILADAIETLSKVDTQCLIKAMSFCTTISNWRHGWNDLDGALVGLVGMQAQDDAGPNTSDKSGKSGKRTKFLQILEFNILRRQVNGLV